MGLLVRFLINAIAIALATQIYPAAFTVQDLRTTLLAALVLALVNASLRPVVLILVLPLNLLTLGLFTLVVNTLMLYLVVWILGIPHGGFGPMFVASLLITLLSVVLSLIVR